MGDRDIRLHANITLTTYISAAVPLFQNPQHGGHSKAIPNQHSRNAKSSACISHWIINPQIKHITPNFRNFQNHTFFSFIGAPCVRYRHHIVYQGSYRGHIDLLELPGSQPESWRVRGVRGRCRNIDFRNRPRGCISE